MAKGRLSGRFAVILHADVAGSTALVQQDKELAHERIQFSFRRFSETIENYQGHVLELRGDALLAEFERAAEAVSAALSLQEDQTNYNDQLPDDLRPVIRIGIAMGEVVIGTTTLRALHTILWATLNRQRIVSRKRWIEIRMFILCAQPLQHLLQWKAFKTTPNGR